MILSFRIEFMHREAFANIYCNDPQFNILRSMFSGGKGGGEGGGGEEGG